MIVKEKIYYCQVKTILGFVRGNKTLSLPTEHEVLLFVREERELKFFRGHLS